MPKLEGIPISRQHLRARLAFEMHAGNLKDWLLVIEEGHRFSQDQGLRAFLIEARKFTRKLILVTTDWRLYEGIGKVFKPKPWDSLLP